VFAVALVPDEEDGVKVTGPNGKTWLVSQDEVGLGGRADTGRQLFRRGELATWHREPTVRAGGATETEGGEA
jgi:hypothetical protein